MFTLLRSFLSVSDRFSTWFDHHFGWFFTNGMKEGRSH